MYLWINNFQTSFTFHWLSPNVYKIWNDTFAHCHVTIGRCAGDNPCIAKIAQRKHLFASFLSTYRTITDQRVKWAAPFLKLHANWHLSRCVIILRPCAKSKFDIICGVQPNASSRIPRVLSSVCPIVFDVYVCGLPESAVMIMRANARLTSAYKLWLRCRLVMCFIGGGSTHVI